MEMFFKKSMLAGLGLLSLTKEKVEEFIDDLIKRGEISQDQKSQYMKETMEKLDQRRKEASEWVELQVNEVMEKIKPKTTQQIDELNAKIDKIDTELKKLQKELAKLKK